MTLKSFIFNALFFNLLFIVSLKGDKVPSTTDIDDYDDPVLREVFASSRKQNGGVDQTVSQTPQYNRNTNVGQQRTRTYVSQPQQSSVSPYRPVEQSAYSSYTSNQQSSYTPNQQPSFSQNYNSNQQTSDFGSLAAQGAQTFVQGAQQVGRVFGIDNSAYSTGSNYEFPLGGGFFGR